MIMSIYDQRILSETAWYFRSVVQAQAAEAMHITNRKFTFYLGAVAHLKQQSPGGR